jgi:putative transposase
MPRTARVAPGGYVYHVLNRSAGRMQMFRKDADFEAFQDVLVEAYDKHPIRILSYCILSNHWHFVVWPKADGQLSEFFRWLAQTHAIRWRVSHRSVGHGPLYQGRFKSLPVQNDANLLTLLRYVERYPLSAGLVTKAQLWRWGSLWSRVHGEKAVKAILSPWPVERPANWTARVNTPLSAQELDRVRLSVERGRPYGEDKWVRQTVEKLGLMHTVRPEGRPRKGPPPASDT